MCEDRVEIGVGYKELELAHCVVRPVVFICLLFVFMQGNVITNFLCIIFLALKFLGCVILVLSFLGDFSVTGTVTPKFILRVG